jgi:hypothetical protein
MGGNIEAPTATTEHAVTGVFGKAKPEKSGCSHLGIIIAMILIIRKLYYTFNYEYCQFGRDGKLKVF